MKINELCFCFVFLLCRRKVSTWPILNPVPPVSIKRIMSSSSMWMPRAPRSWMKSLRASKHRSAGMYMSCLATRQRTQVNECSVTFSFPFYTFLKATCWSMVTLSVLDLFQSKYLTLCHSPVPQMEMMIKMESLGEIFIISCSV